MAQSRVSKECMEEAKAVLKTFTEVDLEKYVSQVLEKARSYTDLHGQEAIQAAIKEINNVRAQTYLEQLQIKVNTKAKFEKASSAIKEKKSTLLNTLVRRLSNLSNNVESAQRNAFKRLTDRFFNILTDDEKVYLHNHQNDIEIMRAVDGKPASDIAKSIAKKFNDYIIARNAEMIQSNALPMMFINRDRSLRAIHDSSRMLRAGRNLVQSALAKKYSVGEAKNIWREYIKPLLNIKETFSETEALDLKGKIDSKKVDEILDTIFDDITTGKAEISSFGKGRNMFFYWKDSESWMAYNKQYGKGDLLSALQSDIHGSANKIGMAEIMGDTPEKTFNDLAEVEQKYNPQSKLANYQSELSYKWLSGLDRAPVNASISSFFSAIRGLTAASKLVGRVTLLSLPDISNGIAFAHRYGYSFSKSYGTYLSGMFNLLQTEERKYLANMFKEMTDTHLGYMMRFLDANDPGQLINSMNTFLYRKTLMDALDRGNKISSMQIMSRLVGDNTHLKFDLLPDKMKDLLDKFNISANEWNGIRHRTKTLNGKKLFSLDNIESLTNDDLRKMYGVKGREMSLYELRTNLHRKVYSLFDVASENAVLTPGAFMKASTNFGKSGTIVGELLRSMIQFKMYPLEFVDRVLYQGMKSADGAQNKLIYAGVLFGATLPLSILSMMLDNISRGKSMPDWNKMNFGERVSYSQQILFPGLGILAGVLDPNNQSSTKAAQFVTTPSIQFMYEGLFLAPALIEGMGEGDLRRAKKAFKKMGESIIPGMGMPVIAPLMREMFGEKPYLQPGQKQLYGA